MKESLHEKGKAIGYLLGHIRQLSRYVIDGRYMIDKTIISSRTA